MNADHSDRLRERQSAVNSPEVGGKTSLGDLFWAFGLVPCFFPLRFLEARTLGS
jgi:hypothetical protein